MGTVDRVLPWRRHTPAPAEQLAPIHAAFKQRQSKAATTLLARAYEVASEAHRDQFRSSGEAYINHPLAVAKIVAEIGLDETTIAAALLHDAVEDSDLTVADVRTAFGDDVANIVDGVTKIDRLQFDSKEAQQAATMRKLLVAVARDIRVLVIKLADRLHNMRTLAGTSLDKQQRVASETMGIYAPLAHRLGMQELRQQLEDLSFAALYPNRYAELDNLVATRSPEREVYLAKVVADIRGRLATLKIDAEVSGRTKHLWSIYEKMVEKAKGFDEIFDVVAVRVIVATDKDCYAAIGCVHGAWRPISGRFKDYIATPKFNHYQSLHTTAIGPEGKVVEFQIRTREMHRRAEWGIASHWSYKDHEKAGFDWLNRIVDWQAELSDPTQFMDSLRKDLQQDEVFVLTPKGDAITLPSGSTPVDLAYAIHSEVGHHCIGARANGQLVPLSHPLQSGDSCEIITSKVGPGGPKEEWLEFVATAKARNKIRQYFSRERRDDSVELGRDRLVEAFEKEGLNADAAFASEHYAAELTNFSDPDTFLRAVGDGNIVARAVALRVARAIRPNVEDAAGDEPARATFVVALNVVSLDRPGLLRDVTTMMSDASINIVSSSTQVRAAVSRMNFEFRLASLDHLAVVIRSLQAIPGVYEVTRADVSPEPIASAV